MTAMQQAFSEAATKGLLWPGLWDLEKATSDQIESLERLGEVALVKPSPRSKKLRLVRACPLPDGYLEQMANVLKQQTVTSNIRLVAKQRMIDEGYTSTEEFAAAMMREHLSETAGLALRQARVKDEGSGGYIGAFSQAPTIETNDQQVADFVKETWEIRRDHQAAEAMHTVREFHASDVVEHPERAIDIPRFDATVAERLVALVATGDWDRDLEYAQLKEWDALCACYERLKYNTVEYARGVQQKIQRLYREQDGDGEIPRQEVERLNRQLQGLRVQSLYYSRKFKAALNERHRAVERSGITFGPYRSIEERAKLSAQQWRQRKRQRAAELDRLIGLTPEQHRLWLQSNASYNPRHDGIDAGDGSHNGASAGYDE